MFLFIVVAIEHNTCRMETFSGLISQLVCLSSQSRISDQQVGLPTGSDHLGEYHVISEASLRASEGLCRKEKEKERRRV